MDKHNYNKIYSNDKYTHLYLGCANEDISKKILSIDISKKIFAKGIITVSGNDPDHDSPWITLTITDINDIYTE